jgi:hypothetical protein
MRRAAVSFAWPTLTMVALQIGVQGSWRWVRIAIALVVVGMVQLLLNGWLWEYLGRLSYDLAGQATQQALSAVAWTVGFMIAEKMFGRPAPSATRIRRESTRIRRGSTPGGLSRVDWLIPVVIIVFGVAVMQLAL